MPFIKMNTTLNAKRRPAPTPAPPVIGRVPNHPPRHQTSNFLNTDRAIANTTPTMIAPLTRDSEHANQTDHADHTDMDRMNNLNNLDSNLDRLDTLDTLDHNSQDQSASEPAIKLCFRHKQGQRVRAIFVKSRSRV